MAVEAATLRTREGATAEFQADVDRYGAGRRMGAAVGVLVGALVISLPAYTFPGIHCILLIPLYAVAGGIAWYLNGRGGVVNRASGPCPSCSEAVEITEGGPLSDEALWLRCPRCSTPLEFVEPEPAAG